MTACQSDEHLAVSNLYRIRELYSNARLIAVSDGAKLYRLDAACLELEAKYIEGECLKLVHEKHHSGAWLARTLELAACHADCREIIIHLDPDTWLQRPFLNFPGGPIWGQDLLLAKRFGFKFLHSACMGYTKDFASCMLRRGYLTRPEFACDKYTYFRYSESRKRDWEKASAQRVVCIDHILSDVLHLAGVQWSDWSEEIGLAAHDLNFPVPDRLFEGKAAIHPHLERPSICKI